MRIFAALLVVLAGCHSDSEYFGRFVHPRVADVQNLRGGKFSCMRCPLYFRFEAPKPLIAELIRKHELTRVDYMPCSLEMAMSQGMASWWLDVSELPKLEKYWVEYRPKAGKAGEPRIKLAVVRGQTVFWVTGGIFPKDDYERLTEVAVDDRWCREPPGDQVMREQREKSKKEKH